MNIQRLTELRDLLRADAANPVGVKFDLGSWAAHSALSSHASWHFDIVDGKVVKPPTMSCDTFACALGLACLHPAFQAQGLNFDTHFEGFQNTAVMIPQFEGHDAFEAGARFFDISQGDSEYLFDPDHYDGTPREAEGELFVAQRVDDLINGIIDENRHPDFASDRYDGDDE